MPREITPELAARLVQIQEQSRDYSELNPLVRVVLESSDALIAASQRRVTPELWERLNILDAQ